jgi:hypothetical protein
MGSEIPVEQLNAFQHVDATRSEWHAPFKSARAINILNYIKDVVNDGLSIKASDEIDYKF